VKCVRCKVGDTQVFNSRPEAEGFQVMRRRKCAHCGHRFTTHESTFDPTAQREKRRRQMARYRDRHREEFRERWREQRAVSDAARVLGVDPSQVREAWEEKDRV